MGMPSRAETLSTVRSQGFTNISIPFRWELLRIRAASTHLTQDSPCYRHIAAIPLLPSERHFSAHAQLAHAVNPIILHTGGAINPPGQLPEILDLI